MYKRKDQKGITLMELIIVLAILAIIAAILIPTFTNTTDRARLRSDIQSAQVIQNAMALYQLELGREVTGTLMSDILNELGNAGFITAGVADIQTPQAEWQITAEGIVVVNIYSSPDSIHRAYRTLSATEQQLVVGGRSQ